MLPQGKASPVSAAVKRRWQGRLDGRETWDVHSAVHSPPRSFHTCRSRPREVEWLCRSHSVDSWQDQGSNYLDFFIQGPSSFLRLSKFSGSSILALLCIILQTFKLIIMRMRIYWEGLSLKISDALILKYPSHQGLVNHMEWPTLSAQLNHYILIRQ